MSGDHTLLRMRASDVGFDIRLEPVGRWLLFRAPGNQATLWLSTDEGGYLVAAAPMAVTAEVGHITYAVPLAGSLPLGAAAGWYCTGEVALDRLCRRIATLGHVLPQEPLKRFEVQVEEALATDSSARLTERIAEVRQRVGQNLFRDAMMAYWGGRCAVTGVSHPTLLRASHAKPWTDATDSERLDVHNGLLLVAHLDAAFDAGLVSVRPDGRMLLSTRLGEVERRVLGVGNDTYVGGLAPGHRPFLEWHMERIFRS